MGEFKGKLSGISSRWQVTPRWHKSILCNTSTQISQQAKHKKKSFVKPRPTSHKNDASDWQQVPSYHNNNYKKCFDTKDVYKKQGEMPEVWRFYTILRVSSVQQRNISESLATSMDTWQAYAIKRNRFLSGLGNQRTLCYKLELYMLVTSPYVATPEDLSSSNEPFSLQVRIQHTQPECKQIPTQFHLITHLAYRLKPHHTKKPVSLGKNWTLVQTSISCQLVYTSWCLMIQIWRSLLPCTLDIDTYTTDTVKIVGSCIFYLVHLNTKNLKSDLLCCTEWW